MSSLRCCQVPLPPLTAPDPRPHRARTAPRKPTLSTRRSDASSWFLLASAPRVRGLGGQTAGNWSRLLLVMDGWEHFAEGPIREPFAFDSGHACQRSGVSRPDQNGHRRKSDEPSHVSPPLAEARLLAKPNPAGRANSDQATLSSVESEESTRECAGPHVSPRIQHGYVHIDRRRRLRSDIGPLRRPEGRKARLPGFTPTPSTGRGARAHGRRRRNVPEILSSSRRWHEAAAAI